MKIFISHLMHFGKGKYVAKMHVQINCLAYHPTQDSIDDQSVLGYDLDNVLYSIAKIRADIHSTKHARRR